MFAETWGAFAAHAYVCNLY